MGLVTGTNRWYQSQLAQQAYAQRKWYAHRHSAFSPTTCSWCRVHDGEVIDTQDVITGMSDHLYGRCTFTFFAVVEPPPPGEEPPPPPPPGEEPPPPPPPGEPPETGYCLSPEEYATLQEIIRTDPDYRNTALWRYYQQYGLCPIGEPAGPGTCLTQSEYETYMSIRRQFPTTYQQSPFHDRYMQYGLCP